MKLAFWKRSRPRRPEAGADAGGPDADSENPDQADIEHLRARARRRLIGAAALLLVVVIAVPMVLDPTPRAVPDNIPIDLPSDRTPFAPKLAAAAAAPTPAPAAASADAATGTPAAPGSVADGGAPEGQAASPAAAAGAPAAGAAARTSARIYVQAAALAKESTARELSEKLNRSGLTSFIERTERNGNTRYRVRLGPFATRDEAERTRARLQALGVNSNIVTA
jgi:DedD protein